MASASLMLGKTMRKPHSTGKQATDLNSNYGRRLSYRFTAKL